MCILLGKLNIKYILELFYMYKFLAHSKNKKNDMIYICHRLHTLNKIHPINIEFTYLLILNHNRIELISFIQLKYKNSIYHHQGKNKQHPQLNQILSRNVIWVF